MAPGGPVPPPAGAPIPLLKGKIPGGPTRAPFGGPATPAPGDPCIAKGKGRGSPPGKPGKVFLMDNRSYPPPGKKRRGGGSPLGAVRRPVSHVGGPCAPPQGKMRGGGNPQIPPGILRPGGQGLGLGGKGRADVAPMGCVAPQNPRPPPRPPTPAPQGEGRAGGATRNGEFPGTPGPSPGKFIFLKNLVFDTLPFEKLLVFMFHHVLKNEYLLPSLMHKA